LLHELPAAHRQLQHPQGPVAIQPAADGARAARPSRRAGNRHRVPAGSAGQPRPARQPFPALAGSAAGQVYTDFAYGKNCIYDTGHHGNAILSRYKILSWENEDISAHAFESRGMLHCEIEVPGVAGPVHCINVHLGLTERGRKRQLAMIAARVRAMVPDDAPLILAGDFNDWLVRAGRYFEDELGLVEVFETHHGKAARSYPSILPVFQLDRIYVRRFNIEAAQVHTGNAWHRISDHAALTAKLSPA
jgi:endonuclease/exonuclease/phosphatase family metal-dependent hydrolase